MSAKQSILKSGAAAKEPKKGKKKTVEVTFDAANDLKGVKTDSKKVISIAKEDQTLKNLFITAQDEDAALEDFEKEKAD